MADRNTPAEPASPRQPFSFYAAQGRLYATNTDQKLIDLGEIRQDGDRFGYELDGNHASAQGLPSREAVLRHVADHVRFLWLDGQFTALADLREEGHAPNLEGAARIDVMLDEFRAGEPMQDASV